MSRDLESRAAQPALNRRSPMLASSPGSPVPALASPLSCDRVVMAGTRACRGAGSRSRPERAGRASGRPTESPQVRARARRRRQGLTFQRVGYDGPGDGHGCIPVWRSDRDNADDLVSQVRADDARGPAPRRLAGGHREGGRVGKAAAITPDSCGDVVAAEWFVHVWHCKSGLCHFRPRYAPQALKSHAEDQGRSCREAAGTSVSARLSRIHGQALPCRPAALSGRYLCAGSTRFAAAQDGDLIGT